MLSDRGGIPYESKKKVLTLLVMKKATQCCPGFSLGSVLLMKQVNGRGLIGILLPGNVGSRVGCEDGYSRCGLTLHFSSFLHHAQVCDRNPVSDQLDQVVVDGVDDDRQCSAVPNLRLKFNFPWSSRLMCGSSGILSGVRSKAKSEYPPLNSG